MMNPHEQIPVIQFLEENQGKVLPLEPEAFRNYASELRDLRFYTDARDFQGFFESFGIACDTSTPIAKLPGWHYCQLPKGWRVTAELRKRGECGDEIATFEDGDGQIVFSLVADTEHCSIIKTVGGLSQYFKPYVEYDDRAQPGTQPDEEDCYDTPGATKLNRRAKAGKILKGRRARKKPVSMF